MKSFIKNIKHNNRYSYIVHENSYFFISLFFKLFWFIFDHIFRDEINIMHINLTHSLSNRFSVYFPFRLRESHAPHIVKINSFAYKIYRINSLLLKNVTIWYKCFIHNIYASIYNFMKYFIIMFVQHIQHIHAAC